MMLEMLFRPDWVVDKQNPFNLAGFLDQYAKAVTAATPGERSRAMAGALIAAGAMLHVLGDLGAPSRVRSDFAAHLEALTLHSGYADHGDNAALKAAAAKTKPIVQSHIDELKKIGGDALKDALPGK